MVAMMELIKLRGTYNKIKNFPNSSLLSLIKNGGAVTPPFPVRHSYIKFEAGLRLPRYL